MEEALSVAVFLAVANKAIVDYLAEPVRKRLPDLDTWWLVYVALVTGGVLGWFSGVNLFDTYISEVLVGRILTAIVVGGGSSLIHNIFDQQ